MNKRKYKYLLVINGDGGSFGAGEVVVVELDQPIGLLAKVDEDGQYLEINGDRIDYFFAHTEDDVKEMFAKPSTF